MALTLKVSVLKVDLYSPVLKFRTSRLELNVETSLLWQILLIGKIKLTKSQKFK
jgi:hypothetical protein